MSLFFDFVKISCESAAVYAANYIDAIDSYDGQYQSERVYCGFHVGNIAGASKKTMKRIQALVTGQVQVSTEGTNLIEAFALGKEARQNRLRVIEGALSVENQLDAVILHYFFGMSHEKRDAFKSLILDSDWCSFAAKRKLILHIINDMNLLQGTDKPEFDECLRKTMSLRNAFAHGKLSSDATRVWLSFFEGTPRKQELTDDYLTSVETTLRTAFDRVFALSVHIGATTLAESGSGTTESSK